MLIKKCEKRPKVQYSPNPKFGTLFAPHMLKLNFTAETLGKAEAEILPFGDEIYPPNSIVLHYGQSIFEGMKAFRQPDGGAAIFRPDLHAKRFRLSSERLAMPSFHEEIFLQAIKEYVAFEKDSVPHEEEHSLYLRPLLVGRDHIVKVGRSIQYTFYIISSIAGSYFPGGATRGARVYVNPQFVRAFEGGLGETKTAANYAASLYPQQIAEKLGCDQVLYLEGRSHDFIDELGGMNFFIVRGDELVTPPLTGTILHGVTRRSILELAPSLGLKPVEEPISFSKLREDIGRGRVQEAFACGTAAVVHPIQQFVFQKSLDQKPEIIEISAKPEKALKVRNAIMAVQRGTAKAPENWLMHV